LPSRQLFVRIEFGNIILRPSAFMRHVFFTMGVAHRYSVKAPWAVRSEWSIDSERRI